MKCSWKCPRSQHEEILWLNHIAFFYWFPLKWCHLLCRSQQNSILPFQCSAVIRIKSRCAGRHVGGRARLTKYYIVSNTWLRNMNMLSATCGTWWHSARCLHFFLLMPGQPPSTGDMLTLTVNNCSDRFLGLGFTWGCLALKIQKKSLSESWLLFFTNWWAFNYFLLWN